MSDRPPDRQIQPGSNEHRPFYVRAKALPILGMWAVGLTLLLFFWEPITSVALVFLATAVVASTLKPLVEVLPGRRWVIGPLVGALFVVLLFTLPALVGWLLSGPIQHEMQQLPQVRSAINSSLKTLSQRLGLAHAVTVSSLAKPLWTWLTSGQLGSTIAQAAGAVTTGAIALALLCFGTIYLLSQAPGQLTEPLSKLFPKHRQRALHLSIEDAEKRLRWWLLGTLMAMVVIAVACWFGFWMVGLNFALPLALVAGMLEIIPTLGPTIAFAIALLVAAAQGMNVLIGVAVAYLIIQLIESDILQPLVMREVVRVPPVVTLFTIVLWARVLGPFGLLLALPLDLVIWTFADHFIIREPHVI